jgi:hypothetical protein
MADHRSRHTDPEEVQAPVLKDHSAAVEQLAADSNWPVPVVERMYQQQVSLLKQEATVDTYIDLLAERKVRETLRHMPRRPG